MSLPTLRKSVSTVILLGLVMLLMAASSAGAGGCKKVSGKISLQPVPVEECTSPVGMCASGSIKGDIKGTVYFVASSIIPSIDTPTTGVMFATGDALFETPTGTLMTKDALTFATVGDGEYAEVDTIVGGTGSYAGATGAFIAAGTMASGASGTYSGKICTP